MLEHQSLRLGPWSPGPEPERPILDPATGKRLGLARLRPGQRRWWLWRGPDLLSVFETDDEALLMTAERFCGWRPIWVVRDADDRLVGTIRGKTADDGQGRTLAMRDGKWRQWQTSVGALLAEAVKDAGHTRVQFGGDRSPFLRMLLLVDMLAADAGR